MAGVASAGPTRRSKFPPEVVIAAGCLIGVITFGPRSAIGQFQLPILGDFTLGSDVFSFAMALQYLFWGLGQPFAGALADKYGTGRVLTFGAIVYATGLSLMSWASTPLSFNLTAGVLVGLGISACSFNLVLGAFSKLLPPERRSMAFGLGTAAGSFGQFLFSPFAGGMIGAFGWVPTAFTFSAIILICIPLSLALATREPPGKAAQVAGDGPKQTFGQAITEAFSHRSFVLLTLGFFTCGFQLAFVTVHFQRYVVEAGLPAHIGYWAFALVGIFNIVGSLTSGWLGDKMPKNYILCVIYLSRALVTLVFIMTPVTPFSAFAFGILTGLLWLSTVPPTSGLIGVMFGTRHFSMLYGFAFLSHQIGGFMGLMLAGVLRESTGSYDVVWWLSIALGVASALINLPIVEKPVHRAAPVAA
ncbi:MAG: MFS transporter [Beijerinckiaceae bacterium]|nr:MFS transporter [Beijerinckiaceae bacterium]